MAEGIVRATALIPHVGTAYEGPIHISGFPYTIRIEREADAVRVTITDAPMTAEELAKSDALHEAYLRRLMTRASG